MTTTSDLFGGDHVYVITRTQLLDEGSLVDVTPTALAAGYKVQTALTLAAWDHAVAWPADAEQRRGFTGLQDEAGRLWDVLWMSRTANPRTGLFQVYRVPAAGRGTQPRKTTLRAVCHAGDDGEPVVTISLPTED